MTDRSIRDVVAEQLRSYIGTDVNAYPWSDIPNYRREDWRNDADGFIARLEAAGVRLVKEE